MIELKQILYSVKIMFRCFTFAFIMSYLLAKYYVILVFWSVFRKKNSFIDDYPSLMKIEFKMIDYSIEFSDIVGYAMKLRGKEWEYLPKKK